MVLYQLGTPHHNHRQHNSTRFIGVEKYGMKHLSQEPNQLMNCKQQESSLHVPLQ